jgi:hypothetical protein
MKGRVFIQLRQITTKYLQKTVKYLKMCDIMIRT